jgi:DNA replication and repair protein RecF
MSAWKNRESMVENAAPVEIRFGVEEVRLSAFRNYRDQTLALGSGFNVLAGPNAQGKTNFLEALHLLSTTRLLRGQRDGDAVMEGEGRAQVEADLLISRTTLGIVLERGVRKRAFVNGASLPRAADLIGRMPCVCVSAADMEIARGEPSVRRLFLDLELSALYPAYLRHLSLYKRALEQRNALLRDAEGEPDVPAIEPWETQLAEHGSALRQTRVKALGALAAPAEQVHREIGGGERLAVSYVPKDEGMAPEDLLDALARSRALDAMRGGTSVGPHRDDLALEIQGRDARGFGSQGQQRTAVIALKLGCLARAREVLGAPPILLLDDILSDLDERRRESLVEVVLQTAGQAVLTCTEAAAAGERILAAARVFEVRQGAIKEA